jgi:peptidyl-prolyl cis-trans isomerase SurA
MFAFILIVFFLNFSFCPAYSNVKSDQALIAAVVNQHAITERELELRLDFAIATLNMPNTKESKDAMRHQVLQNLIVEKLQESSAKEAEIKISEKEISKSLENVAQENGMTIEQMKERFKSMGIKIDTLRSRMSAQLSWARFIRALFGNQVRVTDSDVEKELEKVKRTLETDQYELVEIVLPIDEKNRAKSKQDADRLYAQVNQPMTNFRLVAQQFGAQSGYVGWRAVRQIDDEVAKIIQNLKVGDVTRPVETQNAHKIVKLLDKKLAGQGSYRSRKISVAKVGIQLPEDMNEENVMVLEAIVTHLKAAKNCKDFQRVGNDANGHTEVVEKQPMANFPEPLQVVLDKVGVNQVAGPLQNERDISLYMVCSVENPEKDLVPTKAEIKEGLEQREFARQAGRLLNKIMATARIAITHEDSRENRFGTKKVESVESVPAPSPAP